MSAGIILTGKTSGDDLSLKVFMEVQEAFDRTNVFMDLITVKTIASGSSAQFIIGGLDGDIAKTQKRTGGSTVVGEDIAVNDIQMDERVIIIDDTVYDARRIDGREEKIAHYEVRGPVTNMIGQVLARKMDSLIAATIALACEAPGNAGFAGNPDAPALIENAAIATGTAEAKGNALAESIFAAEAALRTNEVTSDIYVAVSPTNYNYLVQSKNGVNADYTSGNGGFDKGTIMEVGGVKVVKTTNLGAAGTISSLEGLCFTKEAVGLVNLVGLTAESNYDFNKFATLLSGRYAIGCGILNPSCAVGITSAAQ